MSRWSRWWRRSLTLSGREADVGQPDLRAVPFLATLSPMARSGFWLIPLILLVQTLPGGVRACLAGCCPDGSDLGRQIVSAPWSGNWSGDWSDAAAGSCDCCASERASVSCTDADCLAYGSACCISVDADVDALLPSWPQAEDESPALSAVLPGTPWQDGAEPAMDARPHGRPFAEPDRLPLALVQLRYTRLLI